MSDLNIKIKKASWHRNGVCGEGFYAIIFEEKKEGLMIASLFDEPGCCAVYSILKLQEENIEFAMGNSWRGDVYEDALRPALKKFLEEKGSNRIGPFAIPQK